MQGSTRGVVGAEQRGDGAGVFAGTLQPMGGHDLAGFGTVDSGLLGGSLQLSEGGQRNAGKNRQGNKW